MNAQAQAIIDKVATQKTQIGNVKTLIKGLRELVAGSATQAELLAVLDALTTNDTELDAALSESLDD